VGGVRNRRRRNMGRTRGGWTEKNKIVEEERLGNKKMDKGEYTR
jgi:hypothetical protein